MTLRYGLAPLLLACALMGCNSAIGSRITPENYEKLESGMSKDQVHAILGKPDQAAGDDIGNVLSLLKETWRGRSQTITVTYTNDAMVLKSIDLPDKSSAKP